MPCYGRIDFSGGIGVNERRELKKCGIYRCWYFLN